MRISGEGDPTPGGRGALCGGSWRPCCIDDMLALDRLSPSRDVDKGRGFSMFDYAALITRAQEFVDRKYIARADPRQRAMGLAYVEAERAISHGRSRALPSKKSCEIGSWRQRPPST